MLKGIVSKKIEFFFVVNRASFLNNVALNILFLDRDALLNVLTNEASGSVSVRFGNVADSEIEFETLCDGCFQRGDFLEQINGPRPRSGVSVVNE